MGLAHVSGDRLCLCSLLAPDIEARQHKDEEGDAIHDLVLKNPDAIIVMYV
jgi:hypothetical protein